MGCFSMPKGVPNKRYTGEFKQMVVESMLRKNAATKTAEKLGILPEFWKKGNKSTKNSGYYPVLSEYCYRLF